jgi:hypothetical protein
LKNHPDAAKWQQVFLEDNAKRHEPEHKCNVRKCNTLRLDESYRLVTIVLVQNSHSCKIQNILLATIAARQRKVFSRDEHLW